MATQVMPGATMSRWRRQLQDGWLIAPGAQFSYAEFIGGVTKDQGFVTGFGIVDDGAGGVTTAPVIGGGICQVSTTIFQAAFWAGMQIDERYTHPYWIQTYGEPPRGMKGLDAMVNIDDVNGTLDFKFTNTTGNWIAVQVVDDGTVLTARILGTDPGWTVDVSQPDITDIVKPRYGHAIHRLAGAAGWHETAGRICPGRFYRDHSPHRH